MSGTLLNPKVDAWLAQATKWREEMTTLRVLLLEAGLTEELKWGKPCYSLDGANVVIVLAMKDTCALLFCKGALLTDPEGWLIQPTENTQAARQMRFTSVAEIRKRESAIRRNLTAAIAAERARLDVVYKATADFAVPEEFSAELESNPALRRAFEALTPGRQRGYLLFFAGAKQSKTRAARVEKCRPLILVGKGLHDE